ncbi:hypothetical protein [Glycomyces sp. NPDC048151]|uniref:hypothetical protein n=1 Tax=Glycomyces sp. NPDC048151 TaxID=3364002 RepID=UPI00371BD064
MSLEQASPQELARIADLVSDALTAAAVPWSYAGKPGERESAQLTVDDADDGRGVYITWELSEREHTALMALIEAGEFGDPAVLASGRKRQEGLDRVAAVLRQAGIETVDPEDDFNPYTLEVVSAPDA